MPGIDPDNMQLLMDRSGVTPTMLADELEVSLSYVVRILNGRNKLNRSPVLRRRIADVLHVPQFMIETRDEPARAS